MRIDINPGRAATRAQGAAMPTATRDTVPDRSPPDVTAAIVAITDQARGELRDVSGRVCATVVHATVAIVASLVVVGAALAWQLERVRDAIFMHQSR